MDWLQLKEILDVTQLSKNKRQFLLSWKNSTVGEDTWVAEEHVPQNLKSYFDNFAKVYQESNDQASKQKKKKF